MAKAAKCTVQVRAYADRIIVRCAGEVVAEHARCFGRGRTIYDPWHYLPVLAHRRRCGGAANQADLGASPRRSRLMCPFSSAGASMAHGVETVQVRSTYIRPGKSQSPGPTSPAIAIRAKL